jgi:hypothetical protein
VQMVRLFINPFPHFNQKRRHSDSLLGIKSIVRPAVLGHQDIRLQPNSTAYQCTIPASIMKSNQLTAPPAPLVGERGLQSWWGPNSHLICGQLGNSGGTYNAAFFIHPTKDRPLANLTATMPRLQIHRIQTAEAISTISLLSCRLMSRR